MFLPFRVLVHEDHAPPAEHIPTIFPPEDLPPRIPEYLKTPLYWSALIISAAAFAFSIAMVALALWLRK